MTARPRIDVEIKSKLESLKPETDSSVAAKETFTTDPRGHDGKATVKSLTASVCTVSKGKLKFIQPGRCSLSVSLPQTARYNMVQEKIGVTVLERGLTATELSTMSGVSGTKILNGNFVTDGRTLAELTRTANDFRKLWHAKLRVSMPKELPPESVCLKVYVNWRNKQTLSFGNKWDDCVSGTEPQGQCLKFEPGSQVGGVDGADTVTYDKFYWAVEWRSETLDLQAAKTRPPIVEVLDVRPGACP